MDFTATLQSYLNTPAAERDLQQGATYFLQLSGNQVMYRNIIANLRGNADVLFYQLNKYLQFRLAALTHQQVLDMSKQADDIIAHHHLDKRETTNVRSTNIRETNIRETNIREAENVSAANHQREADNASAASDTDFRRGKRLDHDSLPLEIQALYAENLPILQQMRNIHAQLQVITANATADYCPDSDRYPLLKELIALDKRYHANWKKYDSYTGDADASSAVKENY